MINHTTLPAGRALLLDSAAQSETRNRFWRLFETAFIGDTVVILLALAASSWLRFETKLDRVGLSVDQSSLIRWTDYLLHVGFGALLLSLLLVNFRLYSTQKSLSLRQTFSTLLKATGVWVLSYIGLVALFRIDQEVSRLYVILSAALLLVGLCAWRYALHLGVRREMAAGKLRQRILFVGWSPQAASFIDMVTSDRDSAYEVAGCVPSPQGRYLQAPPARLRKLGDYGDLTDLMRSHSVDMVMVADMGINHGEMVGLANLCEKEMIDFKVIPSCFQILLSGLNLETVSGVPMLGVSSLPLDNPFSRVVKTGIDLAGGAAGLLLSAPVIAVFGLLVYLESPGPVFYFQRRLGRYGRHFQIIKIRSMRLDAEAGGKVGWSTKEDPRRLRIGAFMRRWNIDELPQFWNVLRGDMSLVGPRPERPELIADFKEAIPHYNARHNIKPGITGWAQVKGFRGDTDLRERIRCDLFYIENWSPLLDLQIMAMTVLSRKNAC